MLFLIAMALGAVGCPLTLVTLGGSEIVLSLGLFLTSRSSKPVPISTPAFSIREAGPWLLPPVLAFISIAARGVIDPLNGADNDFRWDHLARLVVDHGSLAGYPAVTAADFQRYAWCDGIPPLAPLLNAGLYLAAGNEIVEIITLRPLAEFLILACLVFRLAQSLWGKSGGWPAVAVLSSSALLLWGLQTEQETGLTAISLLAMVYYLGKASDETTDSDATWAAIAAAIGALAREYGLSFILLGFAVLLRRRRGSAALRFALIATATAGPWYLRNAILTGNPVYPALGRIFPTNAAHQEIMGDIASFWSYQTSPQSFGSVLAVVGVTAPAILAFGLVGLLLKWRPSLVALAGIGLVSALWFWSLPYTAGGWLYAIRVLLPALAIAAAGAGWIGATSQGWRWGLALAVSLVALDGARRAWFMPLDALAVPLGDDFTAWRTEHDLKPRAIRRDVWKILTQAAGPEAIAVDSPDPHTAILSLGGHPVPFTSPQFAAALDPSLSLPSALGALRAAHIRFVTFSLLNPIVAPFVHRHRTLETLANQYQPVATIHGLLIFDLANLTPKPARR